MSPTQKVILSKVSKEFRLKDAANAGGQSTTSAWVLVDRLINAGLVKKIGRGLYIKL